jgi:hypothetical protein
VKELRKCYLKICPFGLLIPLNCDTWGTGMQAGAWSSPYLLEEGASRRNSIVLNPFLGILSTTEE